MRNLTLNVDDKRLKEIFSTVAGQNAFVKKVLIIRRFKKRKEPVRRRMSSSSIKRQIRRFHVVVGQCGRQRMD